MSAAQTDKRREQKRRWANDNLRGAKSCVDCGAGIWKRDDRERCRSCANERKRDHWPEVQRRFNAGEPLAAIADAMGTTPDGIQTTLKSMRAQGWDLPHRTPQQGVALNYQYMFHNAVGGKK